MWYEETKQLQIIKYVCHPYSRLTIAQPVDHPSGLVDTSLNLNNLVWFDNTE